MTNEDHPRIHGEHPILKNSSYRTIGSPPHTRGTLLFFCFIVKVKKDHPRIHGEHKDCDEASQELKGSPPHTRGTPTN